MFLGFGSIEVTGNQCQHGSIRGVRADTRVYNWLITIESEKVKMTVLNLVPQKRTSLAQGLLGVALGKKF